MTKEVELGDEFTGTVVKTTTFGAFVELTKGTDGLLHISNVKPGERVETVEDVLERGQQIEVRVVEVDADRGRIGLRLADDPAIAGKSERRARRTSAPVPRWWRRRRPWRQPRRRPWWHRGGGDRGGRGGGSNGGGSDRGQRRPA